VIITQACYPRHNVQNLITTFQSRQLEECGPDTLFAERIEPLDELLALICFPVKLFPFTSKAGAEQPKQVNSSLSTDDNGDKPVEPQQDQEQYHSPQGSTEQLSLLRFCFIFARNIVLVW
jgi:hypothetical protein